MSGRTPSFIVVGLVIIMFLLGLFYMSCSSKNTELRVSLEQFEERYRSVNREFLGGFSFIRLNWNFS